MANKKRESEITVVACYPGEKAEITTIGHTLDSMKSFVDGFIQAIYPFEDNVAIVCNEEGKIRCLEPCRALYDEEGKIYDVIAGAFFICGLGEDDFISLTQEQQEQYLAMFRHPQMFFLLNGEMVAIPMEED